MATDLSDPHYYDCPLCGGRGAAIEVREIARDRFGRILYECAHCQAHVTESLLETAYRWRMMHGDDYVARGQS